MQRIIVECLCKIQVHKRINRSKIRKMILYLIALDNIRSLYEKNQPNQKWFTELSQCNWCLDLSVWYRFMEGEHKMKENLHTKLPQYYIRTIWNMLKKFTNKNPFNILDAIKWTNYNLKPRQQKQTNYWIKCINLV